MEENYTKHEVQKIKDNNQLLKELRRRVNATYRIRIISASRLRNENCEYKKLNIYYSGLVTGLSIVSIGTDNKLFEALSVSNIVLMFSILLSYYMFYISEKNLQERAYKMEETFKDLDILKNKIDITLGNYQDVEESKCKKLYQEYERILKNIENHEEIDYYMYKMNIYNSEGIKDSDHQVYNDIKIKVKKYERINCIKKLVKYAVPFIGSIILIFYIL